MTRWSNADLARIVDADDLKISPLRADGKTHGTPTWIWCIAVDGELFVRAYHGQASRWYQAAVTQKAGQIVAAGVTRNVTFEPVSDGPLNGAIDAAYRAKYATSPYLKPMIGASARSATVRVVPSVEGIGQGDSMKAIEDTAQPPEGRAADKPISTPTIEDVRLVSPALGQYTQRLVTDEVWKRPDLNPRDRSVVTVAALIARNHAAQMPSQFRLALENGVTPSELSEIITHLAFYSGWPNAMSAVAAARDVFHERRIGADQLPNEAAERLPLDKAGEAQRVARVDELFGKVAPGVLKYTTETLFNDLWLRPALAPRDRSLITVSALVASGQVAQITYHLNRAMDNGLSQAQASEAMTQLAFYAGWPNVFSALPVVKDVFEKRPQSPINE